jgi:hypothetical protein
LAAAFCGSAQISRKPTVVSDSEVGLTLRRARTDRRQANIRTDRRGS